jgi:probable F420-dependent oxidoreductase
LKFGVRLPNSGPLASRENLVAIADEAEKLNYDSVWVHDHITWGTEQHRTHLSAGSKEALDEKQKPNFYESITTLTFVAGRCPTVKLGVAVIILPLRNPMVLAKQLANLDVLSEGRIMVGVAPGAPNISKTEFEAVGVKYEERGKITDEYIAAIRTIWSQDLPSFTGKYTSFKDVQLFPKPVQKYPPILIGGGERGISTRALRRVLELGDGWIPAYLTPEEIADGINQVKTQGKAAGRDPSKFFFSHELFTFVDRDSEKARQHAAGSLSTNFVSVEEGEKRSLVGNPRQVADKLELYSKAGEDMVEIKWI